MTSLDLATDRPLVSRARFRAAEVSGYGLVRLQLFHRQDGAIERLVDRLGHELPAPGQVLPHGEGRFLWSAPGEWLVFLPSGAVRLWVAAQEQALAGLPVQIGINSDSHIVIRLAGAGVWDVLSRGSSVDFGGSAFTGGRCLATRFAGITALFVREAAPDEVLLIAERSLARYLAAWLESASLDD